jgi:putative membrane protein
LTLPSSWSAAWLPASSGQHADDPLSARRLLLGWVLDPPVVTLLVLVAALYLWGVVRLARRGVRWGPGRSAAFLLGGLGTVAVATLSGLAAYDTVLLSTHMVQHMLLGMVAPIFLALGAPVTLLLRSLPPGGRRRTVRALHSRPARLLVNPLTGFVVFVASPVALYFTSWYPATLESETQHAVMHTHFLLAGCLFLWPVLGVDPLPVRLPHLARMGLVFAALPFHAFLGLAIMTGDEPLAVEHYSALHRDWGPSLETDQQWAGGLLWASGDLVALLILGALFVQWARADARDAARMDRHLDRLDQGGAPAPQVDHTPDERKVTS